MSAPPGLLEAVFPLMTKWETTAQLPLWSPPEQVLLQILQMQQVLEVLEEPEVLKMLKVLEVLEVPEVL